MENLPLYVVKPIPGGFSSEGPLMPYVQRWQKARHAVGYIRGHLARNTGARIEVYGPDGALFKTIVVPRPDPVDSGGLSY